MSNQPESEETPLTTLAGAVSEALAELRAETKALREEVARLTERVGELEGDVNKLIREG